MATVRALRGVCVGVGQNLQPGDLAEVEGPHLQFLVGIKAVEIYTPPDESEPAGKPAKTVKEK